MRFSLRAMLILTAVIAVYCAVFFALPPGPSILLLMVATIVPLPTAAIAGIIYGKGHVRAFFIGCISSTLWVAATFYFFAILLEGNLFDWEDLMAADAEEVRTLQIICFVVHGSMVVCGLTMVGVRWFCLRSQAAVVVASTAPIEPQDKAELYTILQGRMAGSAAEEISEGFGRSQFLQEGAKIVETKAEAVIR